MSFTETEARVRNMVYGAVFGDALGCTSEFTGRGETSHRDLIGGGAFLISPGGWTDDTDQFLIVAEAVLAEASPDAVPDAVRAGLAAWAAAGPPDIGIATRSALWFGAPDEGSHGNGAMMRTAPLAVYREASVRDDLVRRVARLTHPNSENVEACVEYTGMLSSAVYSGRSSFRAPVSIRETPDADGTMTRSFRRAVWAVAAAGSPEERLLAVCHDGGDADTNAAIAGALIGAATPAKRCWPDRWFGQLADHYRVVDVALALGRRAR